MDYFNADDPAQRTQRCLEISIRHIQAKVLVMMASDPETKKRRRCVDCGHMIPLKRLEVVPGAIRCVACQEDYENKNTGRIFDEYWR